MGVGINSRRAVVVAGCRTPFCKAGTALKGMSAVDLARHAVLELLHRANLDAHSVDEVFFGQVVASPLSPNLAREVSLLPQFPGHVKAASVNQACASANQAIVMGHAQIALGHAEVVIVGGAESLSQFPILHSRRFSDMLVRFRKSKRASERTRLLLGIRPGDLVPATPAIAEPSTGESMGEAAERMAKVNQITREEQDQFAVRSHRLAHAGMQDGRIASEIAPVLDLGPDSMVTADNGVRADASLDQMAKLKPVFDKHYGTVTAANSSSLTDGASAMLLMSEDSATALGHEPLVAIRSYAVAALDPGDQLLMGPAYAIPKALDRAGISWSDIGLVEMHEAFSSQVLSNVRAIESRSWSQEKLGRSEAIGEVNWETLNVMGGSVAFGHPFGATGGRITLTLANEMKRRGVELGLISVCAQGGMGFAMVLELY